MQYDKTRLKEVLKAHKRWLTKTKAWSENDRANLRKIYMAGFDLHGVNLRLADLSGANLYKADLRGADLSGACLRRADLREANLSGAYLYEANLSEAHLMGADLCKADLHCAYLRGANLDEACLCGADLLRADLRAATLNEADLRTADLVETNLFEAHLSGADLLGADLKGADLSEACLHGAKNVPYVPMICPDFGSFIGWKACKADGGKVIVKLLIPEDAKRSSGTGRKCRCDKAIVMEIQNIDGTKSIADIAYSPYRDSFAYKIGETVVPELSFDNDRWKECASGIHFFINRQEAVKYEP